MLKFVGVKIVMAINRDRGGEQKETDKTLRSQAEKALADAKEILPQFQNHFKNYLHLSAPNAFGDLLSFDFHTRKLSGYIDALQKSIEDNNENEMNTKMGYSADALDQLLTTGIVFALAYKNIDEAFVEKMQQMLEANGGHRIKQEDVDALMNKRKLEGRSIDISKIAPTVEEEEYAPIRDDEDDEEVEEKEKHRQRPDVVRLFRLPSEETPLSSSPISVPVEKKQKPLKPAVNQAIERLPELDGIVKDLVALLNKEKDKTSAAKDLVDLTRQLRDQIKQIFPPKAEYGADEEEELYKALNRRYFGDKAVYPLKITTPTAEGNTQWNLLMELSKQLRDIRAYQKISDDEVVRRSSWAGRALDLFMKAIIYKEAELKEERKDKPKEQTKLSEGDQRIVASVLTITLQGIQKTVASQPSSKEKDLELLLANIEEFELALLTLKDSQASVSYTTSERSMIAEGKTTPKDEYVKRVELCLYEIRAMMKDPKLPSMDVSEVRVKFFGCVSLYDFSGEASRLQIAVRDEPFVIKNFTLPKRTPQDIMNMINICKELKHPPVIELVPEHYGKKGMFNASYEAYEGVKKAANYLQRLHGYHEDLAQLEKEKKDDVTQKIELTTIAIELCKIVMQMQHDLINNSSFFQNPIRVDKLEGATKLLKLIQEKIVELNKDKKSEKPKSYDDAISVIENDHRKLFKDINGVEDDLAELFGRARLALSPEPTRVQSRKFGYGHVDE